jgi:flavorubredoxin
MNSDTTPIKKAVVLFDTQYGNTEKIAKALAKGIHKSAIEATCFNINNVQIGTVTQYDFLAIGGPTHYRTASEPMKDFLEKLEQASLRGKHGFAFDTRVDSFWAGSAAKFIEKKLEALGLQIVRPHTSAMVTHAKEQGEESREPETRKTRKERRAREKEERRATAVLEDGMEELFEKIGNEIGEILRRSQTSGQSANAT